MFHVQVVAVKQLDRNGVQGNREFLAEVLTLSLVNHPNLVNLIGYCADGNQRILVYEFMHNVSLEDHLLGMRPFVKYTKHIHLLYMDISVYHMWICTYYTKHIHFPAIIF